MLTVREEDEARLVLVALVKDDTSAARFAKSLGEPTEAPARSRAKSAFNRVRVLRLGRKSRTAKAARAMH